MPTAIEITDASGVVQTINTLPALGQEASASSLPVVLASDQSAVPVSGPLTLEQLVEAELATAASQTAVQSTPGTSAGTALTVQGSASGVAIPVSAGAGVLADIGTGASPGATTVNGRLAALIAALGTPFQAGASIGNESFGISGPLPDTSGGALASMASSASTIATAQGAGGTGIAQPAGGSGILGWLSGILSALTGTLTVQGAGAAGSPAGGVQSVQGASGGTPLNTQGAPSGPPYSGQIALTATAAPISGGTWNPSSPTTLVNGLVIKAPASNTGTVYIGSSGVTSANGYPLSPGEAVSYGPTSAANIYALDSTTTDILVCTGS
jgi:hypothetical protein